MLQRSRQERVELDVDEPGGEVVRRLVELNRKGQTLVVVTHSMDVAKIGHRIIRMQDGRLA